MPRTPNHSELEALEQQIDGIDSSTDFEALDATPTLPGPDAIELVEAIEEGGEDDEFALPEESTGAAGVDADLDTIDAIPWSDWDNDDEPLSEEEHEDLLDSIVHEDVDEDDLVLDPLCEDPDAPGRAEPQAGKRRLKPKPKPRRGRKNPLARPLAAQRKRRGR